MIFWLSLLGFVLAMLTVTAGPTLLLTAYWRLHDWLQDRRRSR